MCIPLAALAFSSEAVNAIPEVLFVSEYLQAAFS